MLAFVARRLAVMVATMLALTFVVFTLVNLEPNLRKLALEQNNVRMSQDAVNIWLQEEGYRRPLVVRYGEWLGNAVTGDLGYSTRFRKPVADILPERLGYTGILAFWVMVIMVPGALIIGVLAGMREGSKTDRSLSVISIATTATPEYVSGIIFTVIFASWLGIFKGVAKAGDVTFVNFTLPVMTMALYGMGYIARMTRASMAEV
ncbi:MAG: ABC transporter permease, partial [Proteobacteria bacterium]|nr:ABC transporter permease [Pseudomonadota bacterium]